LIASATKASKGSLHALLVALAVGIEPLLVVVLRQVLEELVEVVA
jgi:hypothetical protein